MRKLDKILVVDLEATCWENDSDRPVNEISEIIEIGFVEVKINDDVVIGKAESILVQPVHSKVSEFCTKLTTLTQEDVNLGITFEAACKFLKKKYKDITWVSYGDYDRTMFEKQCHRTGAEYPFGPRHINLKNLFAVLDNLPKEVGMPKALDYCGAKLEGTHHRGHDDAANIAKIFAHIVNSYRRDENL